jgi:hypothetical protein
MTGPLKSILFIAAVACVVGGFMALFTAMRFFSLAKANLKPANRRLLHLAGPFAVIIPHFWTDTGNTYRKRFLLALLAFGFFALTMIIITVIAGPFE